MVGQDVFLFDDTIRENIRHARPDATDEKIESACREANCDDFIRKMERGYDTPPARTATCSPVVSGNVSLSPGLF